MRSGPERLGAVRPMTAQPAVLLPDVFAHDMASLLGSLVGTLRSPVHMEPVDNGGHLNALDESGRQLGRKLPTGKLRLLPFNAVAGGRQDG